ncbi:ferritin-like fold-containing protein [Nocardiopsis sp. LOL_012]|uniref:ferritin-like fold-containing protein n=1 Tax=Nocardiopsis sp. LOL_012 TaxID=3345409 RepID=UPI003A886F53
MTTGSSVEPGVIDLLGFLACAELDAFFRLADDAAAAPTLRAKGRLAALAAAEQEHYQEIRSRLADLGVDPEEAMAPFVDVLDRWRARTEPQNWAERLVKAYVADGIAGDFYAKVAALADDETRALVDGVLSEAGRADFVAAAVREALEEDPKAAGRLALWARRLVGEALSQAQEVAVDRPALAALLARGAGQDDGDGVDPSGVGDLAAVSRMFASLTEGHTGRLRAMGLTD